MAGRYEAPRRRRTQGQDPQEGPSRPRRRRRKRRKNPIKFILLGLLAVAAVGLFAGYSYYHGEIQGSRRPKGEVQVEIPQGAGTAKIASILKEEGVIGNSYLFRYYSRKAEADGTYQYGTFTLDPREGYEGIIRRLQEVQQRLESVTVTFPEGYNSFQMGQVLEDAGLCTQEEFLDALENHAFAVDFIGAISDDPLKLVRLEGFLFPDTYEFYTDEDVDSIILRMLQNFQDRILTLDNQAAMQEAGYTLEELVVFASIIQKESANVEEMYNVSSVFTNRLAADSEYPRLESCTTNNFIEDYLSPYFDGEPSQEMLTAYDTYDRSGFPIGAICNAGEDAFDAALHPEKNTLDGDYYFFVTDVEYTHYYGRTYQEHLENIERAKAVNRTYGIEGLIQ